MYNIGRSLRPLEASVVSASAIGLLTITLAHVYLFRMGINTPMVLSFWLPLEFAGVLVLYAVLSNDEKWVFPLVLVFAASLHFVLPLALTPNIVATEDAVYGYQKVVDTISSGNWQFNVGTGSALVYSFYPLSFIFAAVWSEVSSIDPALIANFGFAAINLTTFLTIRMLNIDLLKLSEKQSNLVLFLYALTPTIHRVESHMHYEAYAVIFLPLVLMYILKPRISLGERSVALIAIVSIAFSHYFTSYILIMMAIVIAISYLILRGKRIQGGLVIMSIIAPLAWTSTVAQRVFGVNVVQLNSVLSNLQNFNQLLSKLTIQASTPLASYYPASWFVQLTFARNVVLLLLGLIAMFSLCISRVGRFKFGISRRDMFSYLAATWIFLIFFTVAAYYGVTWSETVLASEGSGAASNRIAEFSFLTFSVFAGIGLFKVASWLQKRIRGSSLEISKLIVSVFLIILFVSGTVVQAYPRAAYDTGYQSAYSDEYPGALQQPFYAGVWWYVVANHTILYRQPFTGSRGVKYIIKGYGHVQWWEDNLTISTVDMNDPNSTAFWVYYAIDTQQVQLPDHLFNVTLSPAIFSSQNETVNMIFNTGRFLILCKPAAS